jgi:hypothetical protein
MAVCVCLALAACASPQREVGQAAPPQIALPPPPPPGEPSDIAGVEDAQIRMTYGTPSFMRKDGHTEMWRYDGADCKAFFFFYPLGTRMAVRHVETIPRGSVIAADENCLAALRAHPSQTPVS